MRTSQLHDKFYKSLTTRALVASALSTFTLEIGMLLTPNISEDTNEKKGLIADLLGLCLYRLLRKDSIMYLSEQTFISSFKVNYPPKVSSN